MSIKLKFVIFILKTLRKLKRFIKKFYKSSKKIKVRKKRRSVALNDIVMVLEELGIKKGDCILVHSGISNIGKVEKGAIGLIDELKKLVGKEGGLMFPAFRFDGTMKNYLDNVSKVDLDLEKVKTGALPSKAVNDKDFFVSAHPTHTVVAYGEQGCNLIAEHNLSETPFDQFSPFYKLGQCGGKIVTIGVDLDKVTNFHVIEDVMGVNFPVNTYLFEDYTVDVITSGVSCQVRTKCHNPDLALVRNCMRFYDDFIENKIMRVATVGDSYIGVIDSEKMNYFLMGKANIGSTIYGKI